MEMREVILNKAKELIQGDRKDTYGDALESFQRIAALWEAYLNVEISAVDASNMMVLLKVSRARGKNDHIDSYIDMAGYAALSGEMATYYEK